MTKSITLRLPEEEYRAFDAICDERGYSKTGKIREFIRNLVKEEIESVKISAEEWAKVEAGMKEIQRGESLSFKELKDELLKRNVEDK
ncbi:MAG: ribbon-helix-helix protein, CopG family [Candidatus Aminicenantaceae bacterium]